MSIITVALLSPDQGTGQITLACANVLINKGLRNHAKRADRADDNRGANLDKIWHANAVGLKLRKNKGSNGLSVAPGLGDRPPGICSDLRLLQDQVRSDGASRRTSSGAGGRTGSVRIEVQYAVFFRAEPANTGLVEDERR